MGVTSFSSTNRVRGGYEHHQLHGWHQWDYGRVCVSGYSTAADVRCKREDGRCVWVYRTVVPDCGDDWRAGVLHL